MNLVLKLFENVNKQMYELSNQLWNMQVYSVLYPVIPVIPVIPLISVISVISVMKFEIK